MDTSVEELSKRIVARCGGLPKVIVIVAECYKKSLEKGIYLNLKAINDNFMHILEGAPSLSGLFSWMESYLETCKDEIKPCIFYLPVFLLGQKVRARRLAQRCSTEGYIKDTSIDTVEQKVTSLFGELMKGDIIWPHISSNTMHYEMNGFFHQYITSQPLEDNLCLALEGSPCSLNTSQRVGPPAQHLTVRNISDTDEDTFMNIDYSRLRSLTVVGECRRFMFDPKKIKMKYVRVLDLEDAKGVEDDHLENIVEVFPRLKLLSLRGCRGIASLPKSLGGLRQLQTLDVRDTSIAKLPEAILQLHKLQYVRGGTRLSSVWDEGGSILLEEDPITVEVDKTLARLAESRGQKIIAANALSAPLEDTTTIAVGAASLLASAQSPTSSVESPLFSAAAATRGSPAPAKDSSTATSNRCYALTIPAGFGKLTTLRTFGVANVGTGRVILEELPKINKLRRFSVCSVNLDNIHCFFSAISGLPHLSRLSVSLDKDDKGQLACLDGSIERPHSSLFERLKLHGHVRVLANSWIKEFATVLRVLDLEVTLQQEVDMQVILDQLLHHENGECKSRLCLKPIYDGMLSVGVIDEVCLRPVELHFSILEIVCTTQLLVTIVGNMPYIYVVKIHCSSGSSLQLSGLQQIDNLKEVWLKGSFSDDSLKQGLLQQLAWHPNKPLLKVFQPSTN